jgi:hypothetical protein
VARSIPEPDIPPVPDIPPPLDVPPLGIMPPPLGIMPPPLDIMPPPGIMPRDFIMSAGIISAQPFIEPVLEQPLIIGVIPPRFGASGFTPPTTAASFSACRRAARSASTLPPAICSRVSAPGVARPGNIGGVLGSGARSRSASRMTRLATAVASSPSAGGDATRSTAAMAYDHFIQALLPALDRLRRRGAITISNTRTTPTFRGVALS